MSKRSVKIICVCLVVLLIGGLLFYYKVLSKIAMLVPVVICALAFLIVKTFNADWRRKEIFKNGLKANDIKEELFKNRDIKDAFNLLDKYKLQSLVTGYVNAEYFDNQEIVYSLAYHLGHYRANSDSEKFMEKVKQRIADEKQKANKQIAILQNQVQEQENKIGELLEQSREDKMAAEDKIREREETIRDLEDNLKTVKVEYEQAYSSAMEYQNQYKKLFEKRKKDVEKLNVELDKLTAEFNALIDKYNDTREVAIYYRDECNKLLADKKIDETDKVDEVFASDMNAEEKHKGGQNIQMDKDNVSQTVADDSILSEIKQMKEQGYSFGQIAERFGMNKGTVYKMLKRAEESESVMSNAS